MAILFNDVPSGAVANNVFIENTLEKRALGLQQVQQRIGLIGQGTSSGTKTTVFSEGQVGSLVGFGSEIHAMSRKLFQNSGSVEVVLLPLLEDGGDTASAGNILFAGAATAAGQIAIYIAGDRIVTNVAIGDTAEDIVDNLVLATRAEIVTTLVKNGVTGEQLDITSKWKGSTGDDITIAVNTGSEEELPAGITSAVVTDMTGGVGIPDVDDALNYVDDDEIMTLIVHPYTDAVNLPKVEAWQAVRWDSAVKKGFGSITAKRGDYATVVTGLTSLRNSWTSSIVRNASPQLSAQVASAVVGQVAKSAGQDPSSQFNALVLNGIDLPLSADRWDYTVRNTALLNGCSTLTEVAGKVQIDQIRNTYQTTTQATDAPEVDREFVRVTLLTAITYDRDTSFSSLWGRSKLANDGTLIAPGQKVMTPARMKSFLISRYKLYLAQNWVEPEFIDSEGNITEYKDTIIAERNATNPNRIDVQDEIFVIGNMRIAAFKLGYNFAI